MTELSTGSEHGLNGLVVLGSKAPRQSREGESVKSVDSSWAGRFSRRQSDLGDRPTVLLGDGRKARWAQRCRVAIAGSLGCTSGGKRCATPLAAGSVWRDVGLA